MFGCNNDRFFPEKYTVKDQISNTKLEKGDPNTAQGSKYTIQTKGAHTPRASYNTT